MAEMSAVEPGSFLAGVDRAAFAVALIERLRRAGMTVSLDRAGALSTALAVCPPLDRDRLYWVLRITLLGDVADLAAFDAVFEAVFVAATSGADPHARRRSPSVAPERPGDGLVRLDRSLDEPGAPASVPWLTRPAAVAPGEDDDDPSPPVPQLRPGRRPLEPTSGFEDLDEATLASLVAHLERMAPRWPRRRSRRRRRASSGSVDLRATLARSRRSGWEPVVAVHRRPVRRDRRLVMLCDVSQSMQPYVTVYLHLMRVLARHRQAEVFAFGTTLTRLTPVLSHRRVEVAVAQAAETVTDRFAGTRLGSSLGALLSSRHGDTTRGAVVVIASDGWDSDPPELTEAAMARLRRRAHRIVWINPRAAAPGFEPRAGAMAAAWHHCDAVVSGHDLEALADVIDAIARDA